MSQMLFLSFTVLIRKRCGTDKGIFVVLLTTWKLRESNAIMNIPSASAAPLFLGCAQRLGLLHRIEVL